MTRDFDNESAQDRANLSFENLVREKFAFLNDQGFSEVESIPTLMRYGKDGVEVDVYHGRHSFEIGAGVTGFGVQYAMGELIRSSDPATAKRYRNAAARTPKGMAAGLEELSSLMKRYGTVALRGDPQFFAALKHQRKSWSEEYALDVLVEQLRPRADVAFRRGDFSKAAELYVRIRSRLSPREIKKLTLAEERSRGQCRAPGANNG